MTRFNPGRIPVATVCNTKLFHIETRRGGSPIARKGRRLTTIEREHSLSIEGYRLHAMIHHEAATTHREEAEEVAVKATHNS